MLGTTSHHLATGSALRVHRITLRYQPPPHAQLPVARGPWVSGGPCQGLRLGPRVGLVEGARAEEKERGATAVVAQAAAVEERGGVDGVQGGGLPLEGRCDWGVCDGVGVLCSSLGVGRRVWVGECGKVCADAVHGYIRLHDYVGKQSTTMCEEIDH